MANDTLHPCTCPRCNSAGKSVAAMHYSETRRLDKSGNFSGSGIGIGTGGLGVGIGGGSYSENGYSATKRAASFAEPTVVLLPVAGILFVAMMGAAAYIALPEFMSTMSPDGGGNVVSSQLQHMKSGLRSVVQYLAPIAVFAVLAAGFNRAWGNHRTNERTINEDFPKILDRYNELRYCEHCHILFDEQGRFANGNAQGLSKMLAYLDN